MHVLPLAAAAIAVGIVLVNVVSPPVVAAGPCAGCVFPFGLAGQSVRMARLLGELFDELLDVIPIHMFHRAVVAAVYEVARFGAPHRLTAGLRHFIVAQRKSTDVDATACQAPEMATTPAGNCPLLPPHWSDRRRDRGAVQAGQWFGELVGVKINGATTWHSAFQCRNRVGTSLRKSTPAKYRQLLRAIFFIGISSFVS